MSTHIQDRLEAVRFEAERLALVGLSGDNNCFSCDTHKRCRSWSARAVGRDYAVVERLCEIAGSCEGGMLRWYGEHHTTPEAFISRGRKAIKEALSLDDTRKLRQIYLTAQTALTVEDSKNGQKWLFDELTKIKAGVEEDYFGSPQLVWHWNIYDSSERDIWLKYWNHKIHVELQLRVSGPGKV